MNFISVVVPSLQQVKSKHDMCLLIVDVLLYFACVIAGGGPDWPAVLLILPGGRGAGTVRYSVTVLLRPHSQPVWTGQHVSASGADFRTRTMKMLGM